MPFVAHVSPLIPFVQGIQQVQTATRGTAVQGVQLAAQQVQEVLLQGLELRLGLGVGLALGPCTNYNNLLIFLVVLVI